MPEQRENGAAIHTVIIFTTRIEKLSEFYRLGLGIGPFQESPNHRGCHVGDIYFGFDQIDKDTDRSPMTSGTTIWFEVDDIHARFDRLVELGATVRYPPMEKPHAGFLASLMDPDGNIFGIAQRRNIENVSSGG